VRKADNLPPYCAVVTKSGTLTSENPVGLFRPVMGLLYLYLYLQVEVLCENRASYVGITDF